MNRKEYKDVGEVYRDRFKDHESELNETSWSKIREKLPQNKNRFVFFKNIIPNYRFITGVITGILITSFIFLITEQKNNKENNPELAVNSIENPSNNHDNSEKDFSPKQESSSNNNNSDKTNISDSENKISSARKETTNGESNLTEIKPGNSEVQANLSSQQEVWKNIHNHRKESNAFTDENSKAKNNIKDLKKPHHSPKINSPNSPINSLINNSRATNNDVVVVEENRSVQVSKNQNTKVEFSNASNTVRDNSSSIYQGMPVLGSLLPSDLKNPGPTEKKDDEFSSAQNKSVHEKSEDPSIKTKEPNLIINDSILNGNSNNRTSDTHKINHPSLENNREFNSNPSEKNQLSHDSNKNKEETARIDSNSFSNSKPKEKESVKEKYKSTSKLNSSPQSKWVLGYYFSPESSFRKLSASSNYKTQESERNNNEKAKIGFSTGINLGYKISDKIIVSSGLYLLNVGEKGSCYSKDSSTFNYYTNNYTYLGIPLLVGYKIGTNKLGTTINSGLIVSALVSAKNKGDIFYDDDDYSTGNNNDEEEKDEYNRFNLVYTANIEFNYQLYKKLSLNVGPSFKYFLRSIYEEGHEIKSKPYSLGFQAGIKFHY